MKHISTVWLFRAIFKQKIIEHRKQPNIKYIKSQTQEERDSTKKTLPQ